MPRQRFMRPRPLHSPSAWTAFSISHHVQSTLTILLFAQQPQPPKPLGRTPVRTSIHRPSC
ncbi:hypothetical protein BU26DRAFT_328657 [Trematosphaeria pertusa]|uniref:Uncharacterized protein n=1 Tax=Trematosphaeria pertusa TaxID=390896 RepID=A0A6A6ICR9_9PLEO|nr:uncharacterized protein BU26DRAFT_328657 [Trematosphaeria pertusa]KAF2248181.1 hypothetical protein BU26DRAFT_328657 [Trematosphaeria pertusa]